jgi:predicted PurR-regulated permease PerM
MLGVPYALAFAVFTGVAVMVPFFGTLVSTLLPALFVLGAEGLFAAFLVALLGVVVHLAEANIVHPLIMERQVNVPPALSILSVLIMAELLGVMGLLVAVPITATLLVLVRRIYVQRLAAGKGFRRTPRERPLPEPVSSLPGPPTS